MRPSVGGGAGRSWELEISTGVDKAVENYNGVINKVKTDLAPAGSQAETDADEGKTNHHVPGADIWNRVLGLAYIKDDDPEEANQEVGDHGRGKPAWTLFIKRVGLRGQ